MTSKAAGQYCPISALSKKVYSAINYFKYGLMKSTKIPIVEMSGNCSIYFVC